MTGPFWKPPRAATAAALHRKRRERRTVEKRAKEAARRRDRWCRFPLCGCRVKGIALHASHDKHKGMGGNPNGDRSTRERLITFCRVRHQTGAISRHKGTLRTRYLSQLGNDGPVAFEVDVVCVMQAMPNGSWTDALTKVCVHALHATDGWLEVARESRLGVLEPIEPWQKRVLERLAEMDV